MSKQVQGGYSQSLFQHTRICSTDHWYRKKKIIKNRLHWVLEVRNEKDLLGQLAQLPAKVHSFCYGLFTQVSRKPSLGLNKALYNVLSNINIFSVLKQLDAFLCV